MGWKFWRTDDSDSEMSLEELQACAPPPGAHEASPGAPAPAAVATPASSDQFSMTVRDVSWVDGRGTVVSGEVATGTVSVGMAVTLTGSAGERESRVAGIERSRRTVDSASAGETVGLALDTLTRDDVAHGDVLTG